MTALLVLAQHTQETEAGRGAGLIIGVVALIVLAVVIGFMVLHRGSKASRGGVEPAPGEQAGRGEPPFESIARNPDEPRTSH